MSAAKINNDYIKQLNIQAGACKRLGRELQMYEEEHKQFEQKFNKQTDDYDRKKTQEFIDENAAAISDARGRAAKHLAILASALANGEKEAATKSKEYIEAQQIYSQVSALLDGEDVPILSKQSKQIINMHNITSAPSAQVANPELVIEHKLAQPGQPLRVAVYGSSRCSQGDDLWNMSEQLGEQLGKHHFHVITGGYCGTMEAVSLGASRTPNTKIEGIISPSAFPHRGNKGNSYVNITTITDCLQDRIAEFTKRADVFIVLPGNLGTLTELSFTWCVSMVGALSNKSSLPIFAFANPWKQLVTAIKPILGVSDEDEKLIVFVDTVDELINHLIQLQQQHNITPLPSSSPQSSSLSSASSTTTSSSTTAAANTTTATTTTANNNNSTQNGNARFSFAAARAAKNNQ